MLHDIGDPYIPRSESRRMLRRLGAPQATLTETDVLAHALFDEIDPSPQVLLGKFAPGLWAVFRFTFLALHGL